MPNRVLREGIIKSDLVEKLTFAAEVFYRRLMSVADDYGRYDGRAQILRADLYSLRVDRISIEDIGDWRQECESAGLIMTYIVEGKEYVHIKNFNQRLRRMKSKFPAPPEENDGQVRADDGHLTADCGQPRADDSEVRTAARNCPPEGESESESESEGEGEGKPPIPKIDLPHFNPYPDAKSDVVLTDDENQGALEYIFRLKQQLLTKERINDFWRAFVLNLTGKKFYPNRQDLVQHFRNWLAKQDVKTDSAGKAKTEGSAAEQIRQARQKHNA